MATHTRMHTRTLLWLRTRGRCYGYAHEDAHEDAAMAMHTRMHTRTSSSCSVYGYIRNIRSQKAVRTFPLDLQGALCGMVLHHGQGKSLLHLCWTTVDIQKLQMVELRMVEH